MVSIRFGVVFAIRDSNTKVNRLVSDEKTIIKESSVLCSVLCRGCRMDNYVYQVLPGKLRTSFAQPRRAGYLFIEG